MKTKTSTSFCLSTEDDQSNQYEVKKGINCTILGERFDPNYNSGIAIKVECMTFKTREDDSEEELLQVIEVDKDLLEPII